MGNVGSKAGYGSLMFPPRGILCATIEKKKHWDFRFLGPLLVLDNLIPGSMINYLLLMFIHSLANRNGDKGELECLSMSFLNE